MTKTIVNDADMQDILVAMRKLEAYTEIYIRGVLRRNEFTPQQQVEVLKAIFIENWYLSVRSSMEVIIMMVNDWEEAWIDMIQIYNVQYPGTNKFIKSVTAILA